MSGRRAGAVTGTRALDGGMTDWSCAVPGGVGGAAGTALALTAGLGTQGGALAAGTGALLALVAYYGVVGLTE